MTRIIKLQLSLIFALFMLSCKTNDRLEITVGEELISTNYIGNGVEWDPYDEVLDWGAEISDSDWKKIFNRLDFMRMGYVRCMINSPFTYYDKETGKYDKTRNIKSISKLLQYCKDNNITVVYGEYNPPTWAMKDDQRWVDMSTDYLNYLVNDLGFDCIKYFVIFNEPDGNWASTDGDYDLWKSMAFRFHGKMKTYDGLLDKVQLAAPDVVMDYHNSKSEYDSKGWVRQTALDMDSMVGIYDIHSYPGQAEVRDGSYAQKLQQHINEVPQGKQIIFGEAGYKYWREADSLLMKEYNRRLENHSYTKGSDCNMLVYDYFYGLDMPLLCMEVMNAGYSGIAAWMLDDAMHSDGDSGKTKDIKIWGMWNILGEEVFGDPSQEDVRPWYYTWSLMCRYFPKGANIIKTSFDRNKNIFASVAEYNGKYTISIVNFGCEDVRFTLKLPSDLKGVDLYKYEEDHLSKNENGHPTPCQTGLSIGKRYDSSIKAQSFILYTNMK